MKYIFRLIGLIILIICDLIIRLSELVFYPIRLAWHLKFVDYNTTNYRQYEYPKGGSGLTHSPIGYYPTIYHWLFKKGYVEIEKEKEPIKNNSQKTHTLKTTSVMFQMIWDFEKTFELRNNDRDFEAGDYVVLREWGQEFGYSGREIKFKIGSVITDKPHFGLMDGFCLLSFSIGNHFHKDDSFNPFYEIKPSHFVKCEIPDSYDFENSESEYEYLLPEAAHAAGYCIGCGNFWAGLTSFDFSKIQGYCENCVIEVDSEPEQDYSCGENCDCGGCYWDDMPF